MMKIVEWRKCQNQASDIAIACNSLFPVSAEIPEYSYIVTLKWCLVLP